MTKKIKTTKKPKAADPTKCQNTQCQHHSRKGCTLFEGEAWKRCKKAIINKGKQ